MAQASSLYWLPIDKDWPAKLRAFKEASKPAFVEAVDLSRWQLDFVRTNALAKTVADHWPEDIPGECGGKTIRLALLSSSTVDHLIPAIRVAMLRRGLWLETYIVDYGQYLQELMDVGSSLHAFRPSAVLLSLDGHHLTQGLHAAMHVEEAQAHFDAICTMLQDCWRIARDTMGCRVLHQTPLPVLPTLLGSAEHRLPGSGAAFLQKLNAWLRDAADGAGVDLLTVDSWAARDGIATWHSAALWHRSKQEIKPTAAPLYGDLIARVLAARQGRSSKCLVLDLDNTLWGGVIGDDGLAGIALGQGSALGEAFASIQSYARELSRRGIILAVCSKNDEGNAIEAFDKHPEMVLRRTDIACFIANWNNKASNIEAIAKELNIGLDSVVFLDDNPFERNLVRQELPMVEVPEVCDDPTFYAQTLSDAGYFEALGVTGDDRSRTRQYQENRSREALKSSVSDIESYLQSLEMELIWRQFDEVSLQRTTQLINKTNQFNLTTRRYTEDEVRAVILDDRAFGLQLRLTDRFGDNGVIAVVIGRLDGDEGDVRIDTWLMSCRVLGRQVEPATLNLVAGEARRLGARRLIGEYRPTAKNEMVRRHFENLGFAPQAGGAPDSVMSTLSLEEFTPFSTFITMREG